MDEPYLARVVHLVIVAEKCSPFCSIYDYRLWVFHLARGLVDLEHLPIYLLLSVGLYENLEAKSIIGIFKGDGAYAAAFVVFLQLEIFGITNREAIILDSPDDALICTTNTPIQI